MPLLDPNTGFMPDIYIIGLQEIVKLNTNNILIKDKKKVDLWTSMLNQTLIQIQKSYLFRGQSKFSENEKTL